MRRKIVAGAVVVAAVTLLVGLVTVFVVQRAVREQAQAELFRQAEATARFLEEEFGALGLTPGGAGRLGDVPGARQKLARVLRQARVVGGHDVVEAALRLPGGRTVALAPDPSLLTRLPADVDERTALRVVVDGVPMLVAVRRIPLDGGAELVVAIGRTEPLLPVRFVTRSLLVALGVGGVLVVGFGAWFARTTSRRLAGLEAASRAIAAGDLEARAPESGDDELTRVSEAFNEMANRLDAARRRERDFLMSVGHDLRTPLTAIRGYAEALDSGAVSDDDLARVASVLHRQTDRLSRLVEDLMLLARLEARAFTLRPEPVDLAAHVKETLEAYRPRMETALVRFESHLEDVGTVVTDPDRIAQILANLLDNALRYTPEGGTVTVALARDDGVVRLAVADTGPGIDPEDLPRIFDRLYVAERYRPLRPEGSGLGLAIVKELV
ncbi:MAG TPA: HAMP domain-containing sensor histidine kinase, partial [Actinobacteria bacterium]|nr:HAMP domain-containing sensor histidine kinase [Actinomycetota bacterium]